MLVIFLAFASTAAGDVVVFKNGDKLTGKFLRMEKGKMVFAGDMVGELTLDMAQVDGFTTDEPAEFHLTDGTVLKSKALGTQEGKLQLEGTDLVAKQAFPLSEITAINPPPPPKAKWSGNLTGGLASTHGNTFSENGSISFNAQRRAERDRQTAFGDYIISRTEDEEGDKRTTEESLRIGGKYDYFWTKKFYTFLNGRFDKDHVADLDRRLIGGTGIGYQWIEEDTMNFSTDLGLAELCEKYTHRDPDTYEKIVTKSDQISGYLGYHFDWKLHEKFTFLHNLTYYPSMEEFSDYFLSTDAEIRAAITKSMFTNFKAILDYDTSPAEGLTSTNTKYIAGVGWQF